LQREASTFRMTCHYAPGAGSLQLIDPAGLHDSRESPGKICLPEVRGTRLRAISGPSGS